MTDIPDPTSWDHLIEHVQTVEGLSDADRRLGRESIPWLQQELGDGFLVKAVNLGHPVTGMLRNFAPWTRRWMAWFADAMRRASTCPGYSGLLERIKDARRFHEAVSILGPADRLARAGLDVQFDPASSGLKGPTVPDLLVTNRDTGERVFFEISQLLESDAERKSYETFEAITGKFWPLMGNISYCGAVYKSLSRPHLDETVKKIERAISEVLSSGGFRSVMIPNVMSIGIAAKPEDETFSKWAQENDFKIGQFQGPSVRENHLRRLEASIGREQKQLNAESLNIVLIECAGMAPWRVNVRTAAVQLEEAAYSYPHLLAVVVGGAYFGTDNEIGELEGHTYSKRQGPGLSVDGTLILRNRFSKHKLSADAEKRIFKALTS